MSTTHTIDRTLDAVGLFCPMPLAQTRREIDEMEPGQVLEVLADDPAAYQDVPEWAERHGHQVLELTKEGTDIRIVIRKS